VIVTQPRIFAFEDPKFWESYRGTPAWEFERFLAIAEKGTPRPKQEPVPKELAQLREREDLEASLRYTYKLLNI